MKITKILLIISLFCILSGCTWVDENKYNHGKDAMQNKDWDAAIEYFSQIDYADSKDLLVQCEREKGMYENADYDFLNDIVKAISNRQKMNKNGDSYEAIVNAEMEIIADYSNRTFYDKELENLAKQYIAGLKNQKRALNFKYAQYQIYWQKGVVERYTVLKKLHEAYDVFEDDIEFLSTYIAQLSLQEDYLKALQTIEKKLNAQEESEDFLYSLGNNTLSFTLKNNTGYGFDTIYEFTFYDKDGNQIYTTMAYIENIKPMSSFVVSVYVPNSWKVGRWEAYNYYENVDY